MPPPIGAHVSAAGGVMKAISRATDLGFQAIQIHPSSPQTWARPTIDDETAAAFQAGVIEAGIAAAFFHNIYLTNFASATPQVWHGAIGITKAYIELGAKMGVSGTVTHLGSHKGDGLVATLDRVVDGMERVLSETSANSSLIIENTAGAGGTIGRTLEEIEMILARLLPTHTNLAVCIDTCHAYASGIPIHEEEGLEAFLSEFKARIGLERLACIHLNDSKFGFGSNRDRHENLGDGYIGNEAFARILRHPDLQQIPFVMEVPGIEDTGPDRENLERAQRLAGSAI